MTGKYCTNSINLNIKGGKMTTLVGHSGAGKSTILNLIQVYDCDDGDILIDGQSIYKKYLLIKKNISLVETTLFDDTINNVTYAKIDTSDKDIEQAITSAFT